MATELDELKKEQAKFNASAKKMYQVKTQKDIATMVIGTALAIGTLYVVSYAISRGWRAGQA